jgi:hypothetical protein
MQGTDHHVDEVLRHSRAIRSETEALFSELRAAADGIRKALDLKARMEQRPWTTLLAAAGVGYVLGGGLLTPLTSHLLRLGTRALLVPFIRAQALSFVGFGGAAERQGEVGGSEDGSGGL